MPHSFVGSDPVSAEGGFDETAGFPVLLRRRDYGAALYALAEAKRYRIVCFAYVTNQTGRSGDDFEKGNSRGAETALGVVRLAAKAWRRSTNEGPPLRPTQWR
jgi:hypothetical protein